ncbi:unnamed protein product [Alopecurus aequalis]
MAAWVVDLEKTLKESAEVSRWERHCIYHVPACIKDIKSKAYQPQVLSLGPYHHGDPNLQPMEEHKRRALRHLLRRAGRPLQDFAAAVEDAAEQLQSAYMDLHVGREWFLEMMIVDGCFLLEVMRTAAGKNVDEYDNNDPIFSRHGMLYMVPYIRRDMLMLENQLPLLLLQKLYAVESGKHPNDDFVNEIVLRFLAPASPPLQPGIGLGLHPLDVFRRSMLFGEYQKIPSSSWDTQDNGVIRSAVELYEAGIRFKTSKSISLHDIRFRHGVLSMPTGDHPKRCRQRQGGRQVVQQHLEPDSALDAVQRQVNGYFRQSWNMWGANLIHTYFRSPWAFLSLVVFLLVMTIMQTVYTVLSFYRDISPLSAPSPM